MNILFTHSYFYRLDSKQWKFRQPYPPLGTLLAAAVARQQQHKVDFFDTNLQHGPASIFPFLQKKPECLVIYDDGFNYLTKMCLMVMREAAFLMIAEAKKTGCTVIVSSSDASDNYEKYLERGADFVIRGEGEITLRELLMVLQDKQTFHHLQGIAFRDNGKTTVTPARPVIRDLDEFPLPAWDLIDIESYRRIWKRHHGYFSMNIATTRGCPFKCNWCAKPIYGNRYNSRSPEHVVNEIEYLLRSFHPDHFWICDDIFGLKPSWILQFAQLVKARNLKFRYKIQSRVDLLLEDQIIDALATSGVETVWMGAESGSQKILDAMDKGTTVDQIREATRILQQKGIKAAFFLQFGYPGETKEDIDATLRLVLNSMPDEIGISVSYPLPGTKFYETVKDDLKEKKNWSDSDDLAMMFRSTFPPSYYRILHRYIHSRYRIQRGIRQLAKWPPSQFRSIASMIYHAPLSLLQLYRLQKHAAP